MIQDEFLDTFQSYCKEDNPIELREGTVKIFLNTK